MSTHGPDAERQMAEIRRRGRLGALVCVPLVAVGIALGIFANQTLRLHLDVSLYGPACRETCAEVSSRSHGHRLGGRGERGVVRCDCRDADERGSRADVRWPRADLSDGSFGDRALHFGGQEVLSVGTFVLFASTGLALAGLAMRKRRPT